MRTFSWNCRGLGNPRIVQTFWDLVSECQPRFIFLMEVKAKRKKVEKIQKSEGLMVSFLWKEKTLGGSLALLWKDQSSTRLISFSRNHIDVVVQIQGLPRLRWRLTGFYGLLDRNRRNESWNLLKSLKQKLNLPWCCLGDFNDLLS